MRWVQRLRQILAGSPNRRVTDRLGEHYWLIIPPDDAQPSLLFLMSRAGQAGYIELEWIRPDIIENFGLLIEPLYRGRGLGTALLNALIEQARAWSVVAIRGYVRRRDLEAQPHLLDWYARHGFAVAPAVGSAVTVAWLTCTLQSDAPPHNSIP